MKIKLVLPFEHPVVKSWIHKDRGMFKILEIPFTRKMDGRKMIKNIPIGYKYSDRLQ